MDLETAQTNTTAKLPLLKQENGNPFKPAAQTTINVEGTSTTLVPGPVTTDEKTQKKNDVKARSMILMELQNEHLLTFNQYKDAKTLFAAIQIRFGESLDSISNRLQKIVSQLAILGENISQEDLNLKFLRSLPSEWNTHVVVKGTANSSSSSSSQNMAFVSSPSSTNEANTAYGVSTDNIQVSTASTQVSTASTQVSTASLSDATIYAFLANQPNGSQLVHKDLKQIHEDDLEEMDLKWQLALLSMRTRSFRRTVNVEENSSKAMLAIDGAGFDWSFMEDEEVPIDMALMAFSDSEFNKSEFNLATYKRGLTFVEEQLVFYKKIEVIFCEQIAVLNRDISYKDSEISVLKRSQILDKSRKGVGFVSYNAVPPPPTGLFAPPTLDLSNSGLEEFQQHEFEGYGPKTSKSANCNYHQRERVVSGSNYTRVNYNYFAKKAHPNAHRNMAPRAVLMKTGLRPLNTARPVNTAHPKTTVYSARPMSHFSKTA
ncbi:hypothetical protein Tco_0608137 [Tanacetum coccineum]